MSTYTSGQRTILVGRIGTDAADALESIFDTLGGDGSASFTSIAMFNSAAAIALGGGSALGGLLLQSGAGIMTVGGGSDSWTVSCAETATTITVVCETGEYKEVLTANLADAKSVTDGTASLVTYVTTTSALAVKVGAALVSTPPANQTLTNSATITLPVGINKVVDNGGAVTGIIMTAGLYDGQIVNIINAAAASVTFAVAGTSNVADGTSAVIAANRAVQMIYDSGTSLWYRTG